VENIKKLKAKNQKILTVWGVDEELWKQAKVIMMLENKSAGEFVNEALKLAILKYREKYKIFGEKYE